MPRASRRKESTPVQGRDARSRERAPSAQRRRSPFAARTHAPSARDEHALWPPGPLSPLEYERGSSVPIGRALPSPTQRIRAKRASPMCRGWLRRSRDGRTRRPRPRPCRFARRAVGSDTRRRARAGSRSCRRSAATETPRGPDVLGPVSALAAPRHPPLEPPHTPARGSGDPCLPNEAFGR